MGQIGGELEQKLHGVFEYFTIEYAIDYLLPGFGDVRLLDQSFLSLSPCTCFRLLRQPCRTRLDRSTIEKQLLSLLRLPVLFSLSHPVSLGLLITHSRRNQV